ncbi:glycosyltransferase family 2 protein [bacterium]|nr:glycosyltransferase family 2 protein [bacterium]
MKLSLIMPAYNKQNTLREIVEKVVTILEGIDYELIMVDDKSVDNTLELMKEMVRKFGSRLRIVEKEHSGKSQTVKAGILASKGEYVVIQDADMEYDPKDLLIMLDKIQSENLDVVYGNRFGKQNEVVYLQNWIGNSVLSMISAVITWLRANMWPRDMEVCYKMAKGDLYRELAEGLKSKTNFGFEPEITAKFSKVRGMKFAQVPISYYPRTVAEGKKMSAFKHGVEALKEIFMYNFFE